MRENAARLRGALPYSTIDARRVTLAAKNASCVRLRAMVMAGLDPNAVAHRVFHLPDDSIQSGFALRQGNAFERAQLRSGAARLLELLQKTGLLGTADVRILDLTQLPGLNSPNAAVRRRAQRHAIAETERALRAKLAGASDAPNLIIQAHLPLPLGEGAEEAVVRPDVLVACATDPMYRSGEIKSFAALRHLTDEKDVASAATQSGVYGVALEAALRRVGSRDDVPSEAVFIFRKPGGFFGEATVQKIDRDIETARRMLAQRPRSLAEIETLLGSGKTLDDQSNILQLPANFIGVCRTFCPLWQVCLNEGRHAHAPSVLGRDVEEAIGALGSTQRARELMGGATPANEIERDIQRRLRAYHQELRKAAR